MAATNTTVTVGCKLPNGLHLDLGETRVTVRGTNSAKVVGGHGITENVDASFFAAWMDKNKELAFVKNGAIFAHEKRANTEAQAEMMEDAKTGLEPLDPNKLPAGLEKADAK